MYLDQLALLGQLGVEVVHTSSHLAFLLLDLQSLLLYQGGELGRLLNGFSALRHFLLKLGKSGL